MQADDSQGGPFAVALGGPRRTAHVLADTLEASLPLPEEEFGLEGFGGNAHAPGGFQRPATKPEQGLKGGLSRRGLEAGPQALDPLPRAATETGDATRQYEIRGAAQEPLQAAETAPEQAPALPAAHTAEAARPSAQDTWRAKKRSKPSEDAPPTQPQGKLSISAF